jgi:hypothetical protein
MPSIMCVSSLLRRLDHPVRRRRADGRPAGVRLGSWSAKVLVGERRELVLAVDQRTQLAVLFPLTPLEQFRQRFSDALRAMLEELGVTADAVAAEADAIASEPFVPLDDAALRGTLRTLQYICEIELTYHSDLRVVQSNLNDFPHPPPPFVSKLAVAQLFGLPGAEPR